MRGMASPASLLAVQLDDQLLGHGDLDVLAERQAPDDALLAVDIDVQPLRYLATARVGVVVYAWAPLGRRPQLHDVADLGQERGHAGLAPVHLEVAVGHHLPRLATRGREAHAVHDVVQAKLQQPEQVLARHALLALRPLEVLAELALQHAVDPLGLLLLTQLHAERRQLAALQTVHAGRVVPPLDRAAVGEAAGALEEELHALAAAQPALGVAVSRHPRPPLHPPPFGRAAAVVRNGRDVADRADLEPDRLQRADGRFAARSRSAHEDLDLLEAELHRLAGGDLGRRLGRERRALARALEARAARARPRDDVAHLVGESHDRVVERGLHVRDAGADLAALALLAAFFPGSGL